MAFAFVLGVADAEHVVGSPVDQLVNCFGAPDDARYLIVVAAD